LKIKPAITQETEFDVVARTYEELFLENIGRYGKDTTYYAEHKASILFQNTDFEPQEILEFGCGIGRNIPYLQSYFASANVSGYDISIESISAARKNNPGTPFHTADHINQFTNTYDLILIANVFHHIPTDKRLENLQLVKSLLNENGEVIIVEHNPYNPLTVHAVKTCAFDKGAILMKPKEIRALVQNTGLQVIKQRYTLFFPAALRFFRPLEKFLSLLPLGGQFFTQAQKIAR